MCWSRRFPSFLCLGIGQVSCPGVDFSVPSSLRPSQTHKHSRSLWSFQMITTLVVLYAAKMSKTIHFQDFNRSILLKVSVSRLKTNLSPLFNCIDFPKYCAPLLSCQIFPLPLLYVGNHITGLASTKKLRFNHLDFM